MTAARNAAEEIANGRYEDWIDMAKAIEVAINCAAAQAGEDAVRREREAIARMLDDEAAFYEDGATECRDEDDDNDEAAAYDAAARVLKRMASQVRARNNPPAPAPESAEIPEDEIKF